MAIFLVNTTADSGLGSLRQAILDANSSLGVADTIDFDGTLSGRTISLSSGQLSITDSLTINGLGANLLMVDARLQGFRVFNIDNGTSSQLDVIINGLTITGGQSSSDGGGILNRENLTVTNSIISDNTAAFGGGIYILDGTATVTNSTISGNTATRDGGGISNSNGSATVTNSTISVNTAYFGGGIFSSNGTTTVTNSTISGNTAADFGGGVFNDDGTATVINSTISGNRANNGGGGIYNNLNGTATVINSTVSGNTANNGGGIYNYGIANLTNTIIANSTSGGDCKNLSTIQTNLNNVIEDGSCSPALSGDPHLGTFQDNGGSTLTYALLPGSIAIDAGNNTGASGLLFDQRGPDFDRVVNGAVDIGAFEVFEVQQPPLPVTVPESSSVLGILALGVSGLSRWRKGKGRSSKR